MSQKKWNGAGYCWRSSGRSFAGSDLQADNGFEDSTKEGGIDARQQEVSDVNASDESERQKQIDSGSERRESKRK
jgi:hypothetical protein